MRLFHTPIHDEFGRWPVAYIPYGGADFGEIEAVAAAVGDGDDDAYHAAWTASGDRIASAADAALRRGHRASARGLFLRASCFHAASYHLLYGEPVDRRLLASYRRQIDLYERGLALADDPATVLRIPFEGTTLPGYLIPAEGCAGRKRPTLVLTNGYDGTVTDLHFASVVAATRRGYHCLVFDGPGQGGALYEQGLRLRPDWEAVVSAVLDHAVGLDVVDAERIVLQGWSLGGHLALRAASGEHRLAACIADPGLWSIADGFRKAALGIGVPPGEAARLGELSDHWMRQLEAMVEANRKLRWVVCQRGFWTHGVSTVRDYLADVERFTLDGRVAEIRCPTLVTAAESDALARTATAVHEALRCPATLIRFTDAEGAGMHCEMGNRSLLNQRVLDWLDERFAN